MHGMDIEAQKKSLQGLMNNMDENAIQKVPGLTIQIMSGPGISDVPGSDQEEEEIEHAMGELQLHGVSPEEEMSNQESDPLAEIIRKKKMEKMNGVY